MSPALSDVPTPFAHTHTHPWSPERTQGEAETYVQKEVILENPLNWLQEVGPQRQGVLQRLLTFPEELGQRLVPHALGQHRH